MTIHFESCPFQCYQRDRQLSRIWSAVSLYSEAVQLNCAREDSDFKTLLSPVKSYKGPRIVAFLPLVSFTGCFDLGSLFYVQVTGKKSGTVSVPGQIFRELRFVFLRKHSHLEKRQQQQQQKQAHTRLRCC